MKTLVPEKISRKLEKEEINRFNDEISNWSADILNKKHTIRKAEFQKEFMQASLLNKIAEVNNKILSAQAELADLQFDFDNKVTLKQLEKLIREETAQIERIEKNIIARQELLKSQFS